MLDYHRKRKMIRFAFAVEEIYDDSTECEGQSQQFLLRVYSQFSS
jgi:hypothetical protein